VPESGDSIVTANPSSADETFAVTPFGKYCSSAGLRGSWESVGDAEFSRDLVGSAVENGGWSSAKI
jgi:hypothetical protein